MAPRVIAAAEPLYVVLITPLLLFPTLRPTLTVLALAGLILLWLLRLVVRREPWPVTPSNAALLLFCLAIPLAVWASAAPELTIPKLTGLILGLATFHAIGLSARTPRSLSLALAVFGLLGLGFWALGLLGSGLSFLQPFVQRLPPVFLQVIGGADQVVNPNILAGSLIPYLPLTVVLAVYFWQAGNRPLAIIFALAGLLIGATLLQTQSRSAVFGSAAGVAMLVLLLAWLKVGQRGKTVLAAGLVVIATIGIVAAVVVPIMGATNEVVAAGQGSLLDEQLSLASRVEIWSRALYALQDFPFTGVGLGTFPRVLHVLYPLFLVPPDAQVGHAHNMFLQVGVDLGLGGLIAYIALLLTSAVTAWQAACTQRGLTHYLALGLLTSLFSLHVYGITDALDAKPAIVLWVVLGLVAALPQDHERATSSGVPSA